MHLLYMWEISCEEQSEDGSTVWSDCCACGRSVVKVAVFWECDCVSHQLYTSKALHNWWNLQINVLLLMKCIIHWGLALEGPNSFDVFDRQYEWLWDADWSLAGLNSYFQSSLPLLSSLSPRSRQLSNPSARAFCSSGSTLFLTVCCNRVFNIALEHVLICQNIQEAIFGVHYY